MANTKKVPRKQKEKTTRTTVVKSRNCTINSGPLKGKLFDRIKTGRCPRGTKHMSMEELDKLEAMSGSFISSTKNKRPKKKAIRSRTKQDKNEDLRRLYAESAKKKR